MPDFSRLKLNLDVIILSALFLFVFIGNIFAEFVNVYWVQTNKNQFDFYAINTNICPYQVIVNVRILSNMQVNAKLPYDDIIYPADKGKFLFSIKYPSILSNQLKYSFVSFIGDPRDVNVNDCFYYIIPYEEGTVHRVTQGYNTRFSHRGRTKFSIDFGLIEGTPVCAAREGIVVEVNTENSLGGGSKRFKSYANYITIAHEDGTFAQYVHLKKHGSIVNIGDYVSTGQVIGYSGNTGWSNGPHLHFMVYIPVHLGWQTIPTKFMGPDGNPEVITMRNFYYSYHYKAYSTNEIIRNRIFAKSKNIAIIEDTNYGSP